MEFKFKKPKSVEIGGSYSIRCVAKPDVNVDVFVRMPKVYFSKQTVYLIFCESYWEVSIKGLEFITC